MRVEQFIYRKLIISKSKQKSVSSPILKIGVLSIALGMIVMLIAIATGLGLQRKIKQKVTGFNGAIQLSSMENISALNATEPMFFSDSLKNILECNDDIAHIQVFTNKFGIIKTETDFEGVVLKGVGKNYDWSFFKDYLVAGDLPKYNQQISNDVLLSKTIADRLQLNIDDPIYIWFLKKQFFKPPLIRKLNIKGLFTTGFPEFDDNFAITDVRHIQKLNKWQSNEVGGVEVFVKDFSKIDKISNQLYESTPNTINAQPITKIFAPVFSWIALFDSNIIGIIIIMILIASFNMISVILVLILEQTSTIGILKAMGASNLQIRKIFLYQATYLIVRGLIWGNVIGVGLLLIQKYFNVIKLDPETYNVTTAPVYLNPFYVILLNLGVVAMTYLVLIIPSYYINKVSPVKAIKFE